MKQKVPKKNVVPVVVDVKNPSTNYSWSSHHPSIDLRKTPMGRRERTRRVRHSITRIAMIGFAIVVVFVVFEAFTLYAAGDTLKRSGAKIGSNFSNSINALKALEPDKASAALEENKTDIAALNDVLARNHAVGFMDIVGSIIPAFKNTGSLAQNVGALNVDFLNLSTTLVDLKTNGFHNFQSNGPAFLSSLSALRTSIGNITRESQAIKNATANLRGFSSSFAQIDNVIGKNYLEHSAALYKADAFLKGLITILGSENTRHFLILFQNPAEIRPGGGFIGSYADVSVKNGQLEGIDVRDIYDPDGQFFENVVPPYQLQTVTERWGARDANWFFDFPTSARTVSDFLERSKMYEENGVTFDGAIAINIPVIQSVLDVAGPISLPEYNLTIDSKNFLTEVQREVEAGKDKKAGHPKKILKVLAPILLERIKLLDSNQQTELVKRLGTHIAKRDIMFYAKDAELASFLDQSDLDGAVYGTPSNFFGSYLAVVDANVAGGKTDALISQAVTATINLDTNGAVLTDLAITRTHAGGSKKDPWWNQKNQNFIQIFTNSGSTLVSIQGNSVKTEKPSFDYESSNFEENPDLSAIDHSRTALANMNAWSMDEFGKRTFGAWFNVEPAKSATLTLRYHSDNTSLTTPTDGSEYSFVYERQSGVQTNLSATITAPIGFVWKESGTPTYTYTNTDPDGRVALTLTLLKQ